MLQMSCNQWFTDENSLIKRALQHLAAEGTGLIPVLPTADKIQSKCPVATRVGINPTPTWMYAANVLLSVVCREIRDG